MKRVSIILALATILALVLANTALAYQPPDTSAVLGDGKSDFLPSSNLTIVAPTVGDEVYLNTATTNSIYIPSDNITNGGSQKIHSAYAKNTDACASCHSTHNGVGEALLQWADVNTACFACHDGTVAKTYNVVGGLIGDTGAFTSGGLFANAAAGTPDSYSVHGVTASLQTGAAPGGAGEGAAADSFGVWNEEFTCVACHTPHGQGGNARILTADPNGVALANKVVNETLTTTDNTVYHAAKANWIAGYPYSSSTKVEASTNGGTTWTTIRTGIDYRNGLVTFGTADATRTVRASYVPGVRVTMSITGMLTSSETVTYTGGVDAFCGACHTDYNTEGVSSPATNLSGHYTEAYRHAVGYQWHGAVPGLKFESNGAGAYGVTCLTCHVAHGTDQEYWVRSLATADSGYWTTATTHELSGSSALKRKPNMGVCESCHSKGASSNY